MPDSSAERVRRYRRHKAGDHSFCSTGRCSALTRETPSVTDLERVTPTLRDALGFGAAGQDYWDSVTAAGPMAPLQAPLLVEACRIIDRLDKLDRQLHGEDWLRFRHNAEDGTEVTVYVDRVLSEAREQATALKGIVVELMKANGQVKAPVVAKGGALLADLATRRAARSSLSAS